jgi:hypothetical protein
MLQHLCSLCFLKANIVWLLGNNKIVIYDQTFTQIIPQERSAALNPTLFRKQSMLFQKVDMGTRRNINP